MKITESQLRSIIRQELKKTLGEGYYRTNPKEKMQQLGITDLNQLVGKTIFYELNQGEIGKGVVASVDTKAYKFILNPKTVMYDYTRYGHGRGWERQENLRQEDELTRSIDDIVPESKYEEYGIDINASKGNS